MQWRRTNDLDLTVVAGQADVAAKLEELGWIRHAHLEQRWLSPHAVNVDVLPASSADIAEGKLRFAASGHVMNLAGFDLALAHNVPIELDKNTSLDVTTVPVIVVLKMAAWLDRPAERDRDLEDLSYIFDDYLESMDTRRWNDDLISTGLSYENQSAFALGQDVGALIADSHIQLIIRFLEAVSDDSSAEHTQFSRHFRGRTLVSKDEPSAILVERLQAFRRGLEHANRFG